MGITAGSREVPGRNACDKRHTYYIIIIISRRMRRRRSRKGGGGDLEIEMGRM